MALANSWAQRDRENKGMKSSIQCEEKGRGGGSRPLLSLGLGVWGTRTCSRSMGRLRSENAPDDLKSIVFAVLGVDVVSRPGGRA